MRGLLVAALVAAGCGGAQTPAPQSAANAAADGASGAAATDFTLRDVDGRTVRLSDYAGQVVLIDFWATWCVPCQAELPHFEEMYQAQKGKGFVVLAVSMDGPESISGVAPTVRRYNLSYPVLLDEETKVVNIYNPKRTAPLSVLIDKAGRIFRVRQGYNPGDEKLVAADVAQLVK
jgi:peroxiredoxin